MTRITNGTKQQYWEMMYAGIASKYAGDKTLEQMKDECFSIIKKNIDDIGMKYTTDRGDFFEYLLKERDVVLYKTFLISLGNVVIRSDTHKVTIHINPELDQDKYDHVLVHEIGHTYMIDCKKLHMYCDRNIPFIFRYMQDPDEYDIEEENFATEIGEYLLKKWKMLDDKMRVKARVESHV